MKDLLAMRQEANQLAEDAYSKGAMTGPSDLHFPISPEVIAENSETQSPMVRVFVI